MMEGEVGIDETGESWESEVRLGRRRETESYQVSGWGARILSWMQRGEVLAHTAEEWAQRVEVGRGSILKAEVAELL